MKCKLYASTQCAKRIKLIFTINTTVAIYAMYTMHLTPKGIYTNPSVFFFFFFLFCFFWVGPFWIQCYQKDFLLDVMLLLPTYIYIYIYIRKKKRRVNFIPKFHSSLKKFVKYFTMITKRYMYGTKVPNFIGL